MSKNEEPLSGILTEMTIDDVRQLNPEVVVLPIGSTEPHGPHLPYGTDTFQVEAVGRGAVVQANAQGARVLLYPTLPISNNVNFQAFPFACRVSVRTLMLTLLDIIEQIEQDGVRKVVLLNGHGGNPDTLQATVREHVGRRRPGQGAFVCLVHGGSFVPMEVRKMIVHSSSHAGEDETSRMLYLRPDLVRPENFDNFPVQTPVIPQLSDQRMFFVRPWDAYLPVSAGGETKLATAAKGKAVTEEGAKGLADFLINLSREPMHDHFPYPPKNPEAQQPVTTGDAKHNPWQ